MPDMFKTEWEEENCGRKRFWIVAIELVHLSRRRQLAAEHGFGLLPWARKCEVPFDRLPLESRLRLAEISAEVHASESPEKRIPVEIQGYLPDLVVDQLSPAPAFEDDAIDYIVKRIDAWYAQGKTYWRLPKPVVS